MRKSFFITFIILAVLAICSITTFADSKEVKVLVDGKAISFPDMKPYINQDNRTMVPIRFIAEELGAAVDWNQADKRVTIEKDKKIQLVIGENKAAVDGKIVTFDTQAILQESRTMVPLRFISETLGVTVDWEAATRTVTITTNQEVANENFIEPKFQAGVTSYVTSIEIYNHKDYYKEGGYTLQAENLTYPELNVVKMNSAGTVIDAKYNLAKASEDMNNEQSYVSLNAVHNGKSPNIISPKISVADGTKINFKVTVSNGKTTKVYYPTITMGESGSVETK